MKNFNTRLKKFPFDIQSGIHVANAGRFLSGAKVMINTIWGKETPIKNNKQ